MRMEQYTPEIILTLCSEKLRIIRQQFGQSAQVLAQELLLAFAATPGDEEQIARRLKERVDDKVLIYDSKDQTLLTIQQKRKVSLSKDTLLLAAISDAAILVHKTIGYGPTVDNGSIVRHITDTGKNIYFITHYDHM